MSRRFQLSPNTWYIRKYKGDGAIYAYCRCGYKYGCYKLDEHFKVRLGYTFPYCPQCGEYKKFLNMNDNIPAWE